MIPRAGARFLWNQVMTVDIAGYKTAEAPSGEQMPCARRIRWYVVIPNDRGSEEHEIFFSKTINEIVDGEYEASNLFS